ncbi:MAG: succinate dehydrogenase/fumarate reductase iron-sulfur subunit [Proteobacteria bacterium]|nr:succinate dehydrogenase/fumarate reductase iron-sulfur subunit [Pseudomonadota bacterium]
MGAAIEVRVWRGGADGRFETFSVPRRPSQTVLDIVTYIQRRLDPTLSYRFACRVGMCGSCAMTVNGKPRWTCRTHAARLDGDVLTIEPLRNLPPIKDLAADMAPFFDKWAKAGGRFVPSADAGADFATVEPASAERRAADAGIECIGCAVCYSACDLVSWNPDYLGPAALNRAWTLVNDVRDGGNAERLEAVAGDAGCHACHSQQSCREHCPKSLNPTAAIAGLKRATLAAAWKGGE